MFKSTAPPGKGGIAMVVRARAVAALGIAAITVAGCAPRSPEPAADTADDVAAIAAVNEGILGALNSGDWRKLNELTAPDYVAIIGGRAIAGKEQLEASNRRFLEQWRDEETWNPDETIVDGDLAFQRGSFTMTLEPRAGGGEARNLGGTYLHVYQRRSDGSWALTRAMAGTAGE
jgi:ketosteroid isomerase-like protein